MDKEITKKLEKTVSKNQKLSVFSIFMTLYIEYVNFKLFNQFLQKI